MLLDRINNPNDIKKLNKEDYQDLAAEIRQFLVESVSKTGGHLASNLGVVELTMALHLAFDLPNDKLIFDVGHQSYIHKILTGRKDEFATLRKFEGMSGFPKRNESEYDAFDTGHSSTSLSVGLGMCAARDIKGQKNYIVSIIGDGALTGGMVYEAVNNAAKNESNFIIVINDNKMSISENVGGITTILNNIRSTEGYSELKEGVSKGLSKIPVYGDKIVNQIKKTKDSIKQMVIPGMVYENMGITYMGPFDGHDVPKLIKAFNVAKKFKQPVIVHVLTEKGRGYKYAQKYPARFHGIDAFDVETGKSLKQRTKKTYTEIFSNKLCELARLNSNIVGITAAMPDGTGLKRFEKEFPERYFDVGIAEEHAVTFAAGLAVGGLKPVVAIYSSFLQRAYDQIIHDVCIQKLPIVFAIDRSGIVGADGETHQGIFDISYLSTIPNMCILSPSGGEELEKAMEFAADYNGPIAIRYPRGEVSDAVNMAGTYEYAKSPILENGRDIAILSVGNMLDTAYKVLEMLKTKGINATLADARFVKPIDTSLIDELQNSHKLIVTIEENVVTSGYGQAVMQYVNDKAFTCDVLNVALPDSFVVHGNVEQLRKKYGIDTDAIFDKIMTAYERVEK
ncbi:MAG: 1-deoxy-D-xylulose-5-phosphate synthase [Lachnospira sp.]|nr:1-deoxy-D-xylulose-5-phosphate synthase [Lachnospira sp.]